MSEQHQLAVALDRLASTLETETAALKGGLPIDFNDTCRSKNLSLLELDRALRAGGPGRPDAAAAAKLAAVRDLLAVNRSVLELHLDAVREIARVMQAAIMEVESDGTYQRPAPSGRRK